MAAAVVASLARAGAPRTTPDATLREPGDGHVMLGGADGAATRAAAGERTVQWRDIPLLDGRVLPAAELRHAPVVVEYWASWCPFCARQNPHLQALWEAQRAHGLRMVTFSIDRDPQAARRYLATHGYTFPAAMASHDAQRWFGPRRGLPMLYVVDGNGRIVVEEPGEMFPEDVAALARFAPDVPHA